MVHEAMVTATRSNAALTRSTSDDRGASSSSTRRSRTNRSAPAARIMRAWSRFTACQVSSDMPDRSRQDRKGPPEKPVPAPQGPVGQGGGVLMGVEGAILEETVERRPRGHDAGLHWQANDLGRRHGMRVHGFTCPTEFAPTRISP